MTWKELHAIADRLEPRMRAALLAALDRLRGRVDPDAVARALDIVRVPGMPTTRIADDIAAALALVPEDLQGAVRVASDALQAGGRLGAQSLTLRTPMRFDAVSPYAVAAAERQAARLVREVSTATRVAIRQIVKDAIIQGIPPRDAATLIRQVVGLTRRQAAAVRRYRFDQLASGATGVQVEARTARYAARKLRERATTIARTELLGAANRGQIAAWRQASRAGLIDPNAVKVWLVTPDDRLCPVCEPLEGQQRAFHEMFESGDGTTVTAPPLHPQCRCTVVIGVRTAQKEAAA